MLTTMRRFAKGFFAKTLMILLIVSFGVWGVGDILRTHANGSLAVVGHENVSALEFSNQRTAMRQAMASLSLQGIDSGAIDNEIMRRLIQTRLVRLWLKDTHMMVNRSLLAQAIQRDMQFHDITGKFDPKLFTQMLAARRISEHVYLAQLSDELAGKILQTSLDTNDMKVPQSLEKIQLAAQTQTRDALVVSFPLGALNTGAVTDKQIQDFYLAHAAQLYMQPERRTLEYVTLDKTDIESMIDTTITDTALRERYEANKSIAPTFNEARELLTKQLRSEGRDRVLQDFSTTMEDAMAGGASMGEALAKAGVKSQSKLLSRITAAQIATSNDQLLAMVSTKGFSLHDGETSGLQATKDGRYFVVSLKEIIAAAPKPLDEVKGDVRQQVAKDNATNELRNRIQQFKDAFAKTNNVAKTAADLRLSTHSVNAIQRPKTDEHGDIAFPCFHVAKLLKQAPPAIAKN
ncbi:MAG: hypothetical protein B7X02_00795, partial [Rhodospirillales bacterium 12-54-5]